MPTELFIRRPLLWLTLASRIRASILCSPNFGYKHYLKVLGERPVEGLDLSRVKLIFNGAEPISVELCEEFLTRLAPARLPRDSMYPVYGLAEASLAVSFPPPGAPMRTITLNRHALGVGNPVELIDKGSRDAVRLVSEGRAIPYCNVRITDDVDQPLPEGRIGHLHMRGDNVTRGYYESPEVNAASFTADGWLRTGDLALIHQGDLYVSGRAKEIIFVNGQNYYPHDLEAIAQRIGGLELGKVVAAGVRPTGRRDRAADAVRAASRLGGGLPAARHPGRAAHQRADRSRGRGSRAGQAHSEDDERQDPAAPAGAELRRRRVRCGAEGLGGTARSAAAAPRRHRAA